MKKYLIEFVTGIGLLMVSLFVFATSAHAATFTVNDNGDAQAVDPSVSCNTAGDVCTLRSSIEAANAQAGADEIEFNIPGGEGGLHTIFPAAGYPAITEQVTIDGSTQQGSSCGTLVPASLPGSNTPHTLLIEINGAFANHLIDIEANNVTIKGLSMRGGSEAIYSNPGGFINNTLIECNYIGTNADGTAAGGGTEGINLTHNFSMTIQNNLLSGTNSAGLSMNATIGTVQNNLIGTNNTGQTAIPNASGGIYTQHTTSVTYNHNVIAGNNGNLGGLFESQGNQSHLTGNYIGLNVVGSPLANEGAGVTFKGSGNYTVGSTSASDRNVISANGSDGIYIFSNCDVGSTANATVYGNYIGTNASGAAQSGYGNDGAGVNVNEYQGSCGTVFDITIGGNDSGQANIIAGNTAQGILVHQDELHDVFSIVMVGNSIYGNGQFGIDLAGNTDISTGVADTDLGPNPLNSLAIAYPTTVANYYLNTLTINSLSQSGSDITVNYTYQAPSVTENLPQMSQAYVVGYQLDFYINPGTQDGAYSGYAQGKTHLGSFIVDGSESGTTHTFTSPIPLTGTQNITATATVLWQNLECPNDQNVQGDGPPYFDCGPD